MEECNFEEIVFSTLFTLFTSLVTLFIPLFYTLKITSLVVFLVGKRVEVCIVKEITLLEKHYNFKEITLLEIQYNFREILHSLKCNKILRNFTLSKMQYNYTVFVHLFAIYVFWSPKLR